MASDNISLTAVHPDARKSYKRQKNKTAPSDLTEIRGRVEALGMELIEAKDGSLFVLDTDKDVVECVFIRRGEHDEDADIDEWLDVQEKKDQAESVERVPAAAGGDDADEDDASTKYTLMVNPGGDVSIWDLCYSVGAIGEAIGQSKEADESALIGGLASALKAIGDQLVEARGNVDSDDEFKIRKALSRPDSEAEAMRKRLLRTGYDLWCHPLDGSYAVSDGHGRMHLSIVSIREVENWLKSEGIEAKGGASS